MHLQKYRITPRDRDVALRLTSVLLGVWADNRDNLTDLCGSVHPNATRAYIQLRESLVRDTKTAFSTLLLKKVQRSE